MEEILAGASHFIQRSVSDAAYRKDINALHGLLFQNIEMLKRMKLQDEMYQNAPNRRSCSRTPSPKRKRYSSDWYQTSRDQYHYSSDRYRDSEDRENRYRSNRSHSRSRRQVFKSKGLQKLYTFNLFVTSKKRNHKSSNSRIYSATK